MYSMNYKEGLIYKIICKTDDTFCYIGSTYNKLSQRWREHKYRYRRWIEKKNTRKYSIFPYFEKYGIDNFKMIEIKKYKVCAENIRDKKHLSVYELLWILKHKNCINILKPFNPLCKLDEKICNIKYAENNKQKIKNYQNDYYQKNKNKIIEQQKNYYEENKDKKLKQQKIYKKNNEDKIKEKASQKIQCECGSLITKTNISKHLKSKKHQDYIKNLNNNN